MSTIYLEKDPTCLSYAAQGGLSQWSFYLGERDNDFGPQSQAALALFRQSHHFTDPVVKPEKDLTGKSLAAQFDLQASGFYSGLLDNDFGPMSQAALEKRKKDVLYRVRFVTMTDRVNDVAAIKNIQKNKARYLEVAKQTGGPARSPVPWFVIAGLHHMESDGDFTKHLHEGSPLTGRTKFVPKGRPLRPEPPYTWETSALDALAYDGLSKAPIDWSSLSVCLFQCERYNGLGYLQHHPETPTPYLWAGTSVERPGKYVADGYWSANAHSAQIGIASLWASLDLVDLVTGQFKL